MNKFSVFTCILVLLGFSESKNYDYECGNKFFRYNLDDAPAEYGLSAGQYAPCKEAFIGLGLYRGNTYNFGRLQLDPPGLLLCNVGDGPGYFVNDTSQIWYLNREKHHRYEWIDSQQGEVVKNAIEVGVERLGYSLYIGRIARANESVIIGVVVPFMGVLYFLDNDGMSRRTTKGYQVLTCMSCKKERKILPPRFDQNLPPNVDTPPGCVNKWVAYDNDNTPAKDGVSAGVYESGNEAYIGKAKSMGVFIPGRIQTTKTSGFYGVIANRPFFTAKNSYFLAKNPSYTYTWVIFNGTVPSNLVLVRNDKGYFATPIARVTIDGNVRIGKFLYPTAGIADESGVERYYKNFEVLTCNAWAAK